MDSQQAIDALYGNLKIARQENRVLRLHMEKLLTEAHKLLLGQGSSTLEKLVADGRRLIEEDSKIVPYDPKEKMKKLKSYEN